MFCKNCGKDIDSHLLVCPHCGVQVADLDSGDSEPKKMCTLALVGFILSFFISVAGLFCSVLAHDKCQEEDLGGMGFAIAGTVISLVSIVATVVPIVVVVLM